MAKRNQLAGKIRPLVPLWFGFGDNGKKVRVSTAAGDLLLGERDLSKLISIGEKVGGERYGEFLLGTAFALMCHDRKRDLKRHLKRMLAVLDK